MDDELDELEREFKGELNWNENARLIFYILKQFNNKIKIIEARQDEQRLKSAFYGGALGLIMGTIPLIVELVKHLTYHP